MVKSRTQKKFNKKLPTATLTDLTNVTTDYIKHWTNQEIGRLQREENKILCIPTKNGYRVGLYNLTVYPNKTCEVRDRNRELVHCFESKISAILFAIYTIKKNYWTADELLLWDREINKNYVDMLNLRRIIQEARKRKDYVIVDSRNARLEIAETKLDFARDKISKLHKTAKYYKVWE
jgi:hypothetical protein